MSPPVIETGDKFLLITAEKKKSNLQVLFLIA